MLFKDEKFKELMDIPKADRNNLVKFRDKYLVQSFGTSSIVGSDIPARVHMYWDTMLDIGSDVVFMRYLQFDVYVQVSQQYNALPSNGLRRRQDLITERLRYLLHRKRIEGFLFMARDDYDMNSNTLEYNRKFIDFTVKHIN